MRVYNFLVSGLLVCLLLTSCNITEDIVFNENGGGSLKLELDASKLSKGIRSQFGKKDIDSTVTFLSLNRNVADSISKLSLSEQRKFAALKKAKAHLFYAPAAGKFIVTIFADFQSDEELTAGMNAFNAIASDGKYSGFSVMGIDTAIQNINYDYSKHRFERKIIERDVPDLNVQTKNEVATCTYKINYTFAKKIKTAGKEFTVRDDFKSIQASFPLIELIEKPSRTSIQIKFE